MYKYYFLSFKVMYILIILLNNAGEWKRAKKIFTFLTTKYGKIAKSELLYFFGECPFRPLRPSESATGIYANY